MSHPTVISPHIPHEVAMGWLRSPGTSHANTARVPRLWIFEYLKSVVAVHARPSTGALGMGVLPMSHPTVISPHITHEVAMGRLRGPGASRANTAWVPHLWISEC